MPLAFKSESHGGIAFGFFNIESDMLLLDHYFFFADEFCGLVSEIAQTDGEKRFAKSMKVYRIEKQDDVGDLMGAICGIRFTGFIGETYKRYPFPQRKADFKQKPEGFKTKAAFREMIGKYAAVKEIQITADPGTEKVSIGEYVFGKEWFQELVKYVWAGGMPRWLDGRRPGYVLSMKNKVEQSGRRLFEGLKLDLE